MPAIAFDLYPHRCKQCGKKFEAGFDWAYKTSLGSNKYHWFCSWHCIQKFRGTANVRKYRRIKG
jgi:hypothetical protein